MTGTSIILIFSLAVLLGLSAFFSASETAFTSFNRVRMKSLAADGNPKAQAVLDLAENYNGLLSTVLIGNNIVNILSTSLATVLFVGFFGNLGVTISTVVMTLLVLMFGEISPKSLAREAPERFAMAVTPLLRVFKTVLTPVNWLMNRWQALVLRLSKGEARQGATEQELLTYVEEVRSEGGINAQEEGMIRSAIEFDDLEAGDIYTPRVDIQAVSLVAEAADIAILFHRTGYSRLPVYRDTVDSIVGILLQKDFHYYVEGLHQSVEKTMRPVLFVPKTVHISDLLGQLQRAKIHMAVVVDEHGGTLGIVTVEDIVEELVGDIWDEHDEVRHEIIETGEGCYHIYGGADLDEVLELFGIREAEEPDAQTVGGWLTEKLGRIPAQNDVLDYGGLRFTVTEMRRNRVESLEVCPLAGEQKAGEAAE